MEVWLGLVLSAAAVLFLGQVAEEIYEPNSHLEAEVFRAVVAARNPWLTEAAWTSTWLGAPVVLLSVCLLVLGTGWPSGRLADRLGPLCALLVGTAVNIGMKTWFHRPRPGVDFNPLVEEPTYSFPSGHALLSMCVYGFVAYLLMYSPLPGRWRVFLFAALWMLVAAVSLSRIYLGAHHPGDVVGGLTAGVPVLWACLAAHRYVLRLYGNPPSRG